MYLCICRYLLLWNLLKEVIYGNLMNTYGDNGNILMLKYVAEKLGAHVTVDIVSLKDRFDPDAYDIAFFGGGQDYEQTIVSEDLPDKKEDLERFIHDDGVVLAICGGFQNHNRFR